MSDGVSFVSRPRGLVYRDLVARLRDAGLATPDLDARLLLSAATGIDDVALIADPDAFVNVENLKALEKLVALRVAGMPVSRVTGVREFWGLEFSLNAATLDPRPDSETLVEAALETVTDRSASLRLLDFGTGTGCLLLALLSEFSNARGLGVDCADEAVFAARENAARLGLEKRATFQVGDWGAGLEGTFDIIISNPPYIPSGDVASLSREVREHDPSLALDGGTDGLDAYRCLMSDMVRLLAPGGYGFFEFGFGQGAEIVDLAQSAGLESCGVKKDLAGVPRVLIVKRRI